MVPRFLLGPLAALVLASCAQSPPVPPSAAPPSAPEAPESAPAAPKSAPAAPKGNEDAALGARVDRALDLALRERRIVGAVVLVLRDGKVVHRRAVGLADREASKPMTEDTIFRYASVSKPIVSAAALALVDAGALKLDDPVTRWLPEFKPKLADGRAPTITIRHLLTHTSGLGYTLLEPPGGPYHRARVSDGLDQPGLSFEENERRILSAPLLAEPGAAFHYSLSTDILGAIVARAGKGTLPEVVERLVTGPLEMKDTGFRVAARERLAAAYRDGKPEPKLIQDGEVVPLFGSGAAFAPSRAFDERSYPSGGAGMVGTAGDLARLLEMLRTKSGPVLRPETVAAMTENQIGELGGPELGGEGVGFGFGAAVVRDPAKAKTAMTAGTFRWGGAYGHTWFVDRQAKLTVILMTNTAYEGMVGKLPGDIERAVYDR